MLQIVLANQLLSDNKSWDVPHAHLELWEIQPHPHWGHWLPCCLEARKFRIIHWELGQRPNLLDWPTPTIYLFSWHWQCSTINSDWLVLVSKFGFLCRCDWPVGWP
jgi:hypothetical protein